MKAINTVAQYQAALAKIEATKAEMETLESEHAKFITKAIKTTKIVKKNPANNQSWKYEILFGTRKVIAAKTDHKGVVVTEKGKRIGNLFFTLNDVRAAVALGQI